MYCTFYTTPILSVEKIVLKTKKEKRQANVVIDLCSPGIVRKIHYYIRNGMKRFVVSHICSLVFLAICYPLYKIPIRVLIWLLGKVDHLTPSSWLNYIHIAFTCSNFERCDIVVHCSNHTVLWQSVENGQTCTILWQWVLC